MRSLRLLIGVALVVGMFLMTAASALAHEGGNDFVCPVFNSSAVGEHNPNAVEIGGGDYTVIPGKSNHLSVPDHATNMDGAGSPPGDHARPGDPDYTAIWNGD